MNYTCQSEIGKIKTILIKRAKDAFVNDAHLESHWRQLNFLDKPSLHKSITEYETFESYFIGRGMEVLPLPQDDLVNMDSIYCRDASIATNAGMILCNMGKPTRTHEPYAEKKAFDSNGIKVLGEIIFPGTIEGGDVAWINEHTLAVGHTYRTNEEGIRQLKSFLDPLGIEVIVADLPHYKGSTDVFHLMSIFSPVDKNLAVVYSPLMPIRFRNVLIDRGYSLIEVPDSEFESMGCNVLALAPRECLVVEGNPRTREELEKAGCQVLSYRGNEISVKGGGGPTCLTRPIWRERD